MGIKGFVQAGPERAESTLLFSEEEPFPVPIPLAWLFHEPEGLRERGREVGFAAVRHRWFVAGRVLRQGRGRRIKPAFVPAEDEDQLISVEGLELDEDDPFLDLTEEAFHEFGGENDEKMPTVSPGRSLC